MISGWICYVSLVPCVVCVCPSRCTLVLIPQFLPYPLERLVCSNHCISFAHSAFLYEYIRGEQLMYVLNYQSTWIDIQCESNDCSSEQSTLFRLMPPDISDILSVPFLSRYIDFLIILVFWIIMWSTTSRILGGVEKKCLEFSNTRKKSCEFSKKKKMRKIINTFQLQ